MWDRRYFVAVAKIFRMSAEQYRKEEKILEERREKRKRLLSAAMKRARKEISKELKR